MYCIYIVVYASVQLYICMYSCEQLYIILVVLYINVSRCTMLYNYNEKEKQKMQNFRTKIISLNIYWQFSLSATKKGSF